ncbi:hypothetical protein [Thermobifida cellulosilytica]|uniref:Uncharacterized protein n=1 Tax=Thermobifida cellulosilytica TB100 TaxID=665004 RepID=A0A147KDG2_THECS|nr:hypothetical protein [Thermobifida cellulosilytica]KUP95325.1 hypothetical protein AC529_18305 [Thermobifida cellulosilytica TB100]
MRVRTAFEIAAVAAILALGAGAAAADDAITVFPPEAEPGSTVVVRVSCGGGAQWVDYSSPAFSDSEVPRVLLDGAVAAEEEIPLAPDLEPGEYEIRGECGTDDSSRVLYSGVTVLGDGAAHGAPGPSADLAQPPAATPTPSGAPNSGGGGLHRPSDPAVPLAVLGGGLLLVAATGLLSYRRAVRDGC